MTPGLKITLFIILTLMVAAITYINGYLHGRENGRVEGYAEALKDEEEANNLD